MPKILRWIKKVLSLFIQKPRLPRDTIYGLEVFSAKREWFVIVMQWHDDLKNLPLSECEKNLDERSERYAMKWFGKPL